MPRTGTLSNVMDWELWIHGYAKNWHDAFEILGAIGSAAAAGVAVWLASRERADRKIAESDRDKALEAQHRAEQAEAKREREAVARGIVVWLRKSANLEDTRLTIHWANYAQTPVFGVRPGTGSGSSRRHVDYGAALMPGDVEFQVLDRSRTVPNSQAFVEFRDAAGVHWRRWGDGRLEERVGRAREISVPR